MVLVGRKLNRVDRKVTQWMADNGIMLLRLSVGIVFLWFGVLKFFPGLSPAEGLAERTIELVTFGLVAPGTGVIILAIWEVVIGLGLLTRFFLREIILLLFVLMLGTLSPVFLFPEEVFTKFPYAPTLEGQYIIKNLVLISAGIVIGATVRGGYLIPEPEAETN